MVLRGSPRFGEVKIRIPQEYSIKYINDNLNINVTNLI
jgi:hypothetical protein